MRKSHKQDKKNPYEKVFDDANQKLRKLKNCDFIESLEQSTSDNNYASIPFPYGGKGHKQYNVK